MKKRKSITMNERFFKYTGEPGDFVDTGDILRLRQIGLLDYPNVYAWIIDYFHCKNIGGYNPYFSHLCSTDYVKAESIAADWDRAVEWANDMYHGLEQIDANWPGANGGLTIFGKKEDIEKIQADFETMMDEFRKKHPEALISNKFNWDWRG